MANPIQALNENFLYNSMLVRALSHLLLPNERVMARSWLEKLHDMNDTPEQMVLRNDYMWFLLLMLQSKKLGEPFNQPPPTNLKPLRSILAPHIYEEILSATDTNMSWLDQVGHTSDTKQNPVSSHPSEFLDNQPLPRDGIICYMAAFSDHDF